MSNDSVFILLKERRKRAEAKRNAELALKSANLATTVVAYETVPNDDIGDRIEIEYDEKHRGLSDEKKELAFEYFANDFEESKRWAMIYLCTTQDSSDVPKRKSDINKALELIARAEKDVQRSMKIIPYTRGVYTDAIYGESLEEIGFLREQCDYASKFPGCFRELSPLNTKMRLAVLMEDFVAAAGYRDKIKVLISKNSE